MMKKISMYASTIISQFVMYVKSFRLNAIAPCMLLMVFVLSSLVSRAQTPVPMSSQSGLSYTENFADITNWTANFAAGIGANRWASYPITAAGTVPDGKKTTKSSATFATSVSGGVQKGTGNFVFLSTGSSTATEAVAVDFLLDFTGVNAGTISFNWATIDNGNGTRPTSLRVYWSIDNSTFTELTGAQVLDVQSPTTGSVTTLALPSAFNGSSSARLRFYNHAGTITGTGNRDKISIDDLTITSTAAAVPTLNLSGSLTPLTTTYGTSSSAASFSLTGTNMTNAIQVGPLAGFEFADNSAGVYSSTLTLTNAVSVSKTINVRLAASSAVNTYSGSIPVTSTGASAQSISIGSSSVNQKNLTITGITANDKIVDGNTNATLSGTAVLAGVVSGDGPNVILGGTPVAEFVSAAIANNITVNVTGYSISGTKSGNYNLIQPTLSANITATMITQSIVFNALYAATYGDGPITLSATGGASGNPVTYTSSNTSVATISGSTLTIVGNGTAVITASQAGDGVIYANAPNEQQSLLVNAKDLTITGATAANKPYDGTDVASISGGSLVGVVGSDTVVLNGTSGTFASVNVGNPIAVTTAFTLGGAQASRYSLTQAVLSAEITQASQTISFTTMGTKTFGQAPFTLSATGGGSGNAVTFQSDNLSVATVLGNTVTIIGAGTATITASQSGNTNYAAATDVIQTLTVNQASQTISFPALSTKAVGSAPFNLAATGGASGNPVTYQSDNASVATISGTLVTIVGIGTAIITASQSGNANYLAATDVVRTLTVTYPIIAAWDMNSLAGGTNNFGPSPYTATVVSSNAAVGGLTRGSGVSSTGAAAARGWGGLGWNNATPAANISANKFVTCTVKANAGYSMNLGAISPIDYRRSATGATNGLLQYSKDGLNFTDITTLNFTSTSSSGGSVGTVDLSSISALQNIPSATTVTLRLVPYGASSSSGTFYLFDAVNTTDNDFAITGDLNACVSSTSSTTLSICSSATPYSWNTQSLSASGIYTATLTNASGCDSIATLNLTVINSTSNSTTASACDSYTWNVNATTYTASGTYSSVSGCNTENLALTITASSTNTTTASACDSYTWNVNATTYTTSGTYSSVSGCNTENLALTITASSTNNTTASACDSYTWNVNATTYTTSGTYSSVSGCNTENLALTITASSTNNTTASACDSYTWNVNATTYTTSGNYSSVSGCHTENLALTITASLTNNSTASACDSYTWNVNATTYTTSGNYSSVSGCNTENLALTITASSTNNSTASACDSYTWNANATTYTTSGNYSSVSGCNTDNLALTITASSTNNTTASACDSYTWNVNATTYTTSGTYSSVSGCNTENLALTITASSTNNTTASACDSYTWNVNATTYTTSGNYSSVSGCNTENLALTITASSTNTTTASACDSYTWNVNATTYTTSGTYSSVSGCNTENLALTITASSTNTTTASACDSYTWNVNATTYTTSGTYSSVSGCNTENLALTITASSTNTTTASACDSYTWNVNATTYTTSGTYSSVSGCNTENLALTITASSTNNSTASACDSYTWNVNATTYTTSGTYSSVSGCNTENLALTITASSTNNTTASACDSYTWNVNATTYTTSGNYSSVSGCNTENLALTITASSTNNSTASACDSYTWNVNATTYTTSGTYSSVSGCNTENLALTITASSTNNTTASACDSYTWNVNATTYTTSGNYSSVSGCNTENLALTITASSTNTTTASACDSYTWNVNATTYTTSGNYSSVSGCNTENLALTITASSTNNTTASACDSYTWNANATTYTTSGTYSSVSGCNTDNLALTITASSTNNSTASACDSYTWNVNATTYTTSGTYSSVSGCNTENLALTITASSTNNSTASACDSYTWNVNATTYTTSGTYSSVSGCNTENLALTITASSTNNTTASACDSYTWNVNATTYTTSGNYSSVSGCNTENLALTITASSTNNTTASACDSYTWNANATTYTTSGTYSSVSGCNTDNLALTITASSTNNSTASACDSYTWNVNATTYTTSGTYSSVSGCNTENLALTITASSTNNSTASACDSYTWNVNATTYTTSGNYSSVSGCNTDNLALTISSSLSNNTAASACMSYAWLVDGNTYTTSGVYVYANGCSTQTLTLIINTPSTFANTVNALGCYTWSVNSVTYTLTGVYTLTMANAATGCADVYTLNLTVTPGVKLAAKVFLAGPYDAATGMMQDSLRAKGLLVASQPEPYSIAPFNKPQLGEAGGETVSQSVLNVTGHDAIVDWVYLELRSSSNAGVVLSTKRALLQRDGDIVSNIDGTSPVFFANRTPGNYYVSIKHRNHLGVMSLNTLNLGSCNAASIDFTTSDSVFTMSSILNPARKTIGSVRAMWSGDANTNKNVKYNGLSNDKEVVMNAVGLLNLNNIVNGYRIEDINLDSKVKYNGTDNDRALLLNNVGVGTSNNVLSQHTPN